MSGPTEPQIKMILASDHAGIFHLWACRGDGKGCNRNRFRKSIPCNDCFGPLPETMTIGEVHDKLMRGDA